MLYASLLTIGLVASASAQAPRKFARGFKRSLTPPGEAVTSLNITAEEVAAAPAAVDWSYALTPIKDQGSCGSCWAFSTTEGVESAVFRSTGQLPPPLSTEQLVDCEKQDDGCDGGDIPEAIRYLKRKGMATDSDYPDRSSQSGRTRQCTWDGDYDVTVTGMSFAIPQCDRGDCSYQDEDKLAAAVAKYGPLSVCINSGDGQPGDWAKYKSGVWYKECKAKANEIDHCVQLVGYNKTGDEPFWKLRNSWGADWGENGFIRLPFGDSNACCVGCEAVIIEATTATKATNLVEEK